MSMNSDALSPAEAASYVGLKTATLAKLRCLGGSPPYFKLGRRVLYSRDDLDAWRDQRRVRHSAEAEKLPRRLTDMLGIVS
jgi:excisionase family DNA binding protein